MAKTPEQLTDPALEEEARRREAQDSPLAAPGQGQDDLELPEGEGKDPEVRTSQLEMVEQATAAELKEDREKFVRDLIAASIQKMFDEWATYLEDCQNAEVAKQVIESKTDAVIMKQAERFIEEGGMPDFGGGTAYLHIAYFDTDQGQHIEYVTGFEIELDGLKATGGGEEELLEKKERKTLEEEREKGELGEETTS